MAKQIKWLYCCDSTMGHSISIKYPNCIEKISEVITKEGGKTNSFKNEKIINIDKVEITKAQSENRDLSKTVDIAFCIKKTKNINIVLVEFRFNYLNVNNLSKSDLDKKINYSKQLLSSDVQIHDVFYFVFSPQIKNQAYSKLRRLYSNKSSHIAININDLNEIFFKS